MSPNPHSSFLSSGTVIIPAGGTATFYSTGAFFQCKESTDAFKMSLDDGETFPMEAGLGFRLNEPDYFRKLGFKNDTANIITVIFYVGRGEIRDARLNTIVSRLSIVGLKDVADYATGTGTRATPLNATNFGTSYAGTDSSGRQRKQITVTNVDTTGNVWVCDSSDKPVAVVAPGQAWTMASSATYKVFSDYGGGNVKYVCHQTWYTS